MFSACTGKAKTWPPMDESRFGGGAKEDAGTGSDAADHGGAKRAAGDA